ncbi:MAG: O-antigen ligase family protein [Leptospiraceae bacterium]|nr:O-antigen ligase family protein [Leptospiraceae bacterium]MBP9162065.1 O-antigen ligase family protein [Leptospiraceae bacterium]
MSKKGMVGIIFQAWFILFISLYLYFNDAQPNLVKELSANTLMVSVLFLFWQKKKIKGLDSYFFIFSSLSLILYTSITGMIFLPDSLVARQKLYLRFVFYFSVGLFLLLYKLGINKRILIFYTVIASSHIFLYRYHYSSIAILFYLVANLSLLKKFSLNKQNVFDLLVFLLFTASLTSTYTSFFYNGTNAVFGFFHLLSGIILYLYFKYLEDEEEIIKIIRFNHLFYGICLALYSIFILIYIFSHDFNPNFSLSIGGFHVSNIGSMIAVNFPAIIVVYLFFNDTNKVKASYIAIILLSFVVLYYTHSRASTLGVITSSLFIGIYYIKFGKDKKTNLIPILLFLVAFVVIFIGKKVFQSDVFNTGSLIARKSIWEAYTDRVLNHSILFGFGSNNEFFNTFLPINYLSEKVIDDLKYYFNNFQANPHAHNLYIQFFYNYGLYGLLILTGILLSTFALLAKKLIRNDLTLNEILAYSVLSSIFFQEIFDYTMLDAMTFFPTAFALGIISRYSFQLNSVHNLKSFSTININIIYALQFFIAIFISMVGFNLCVSEKVKILFKNEFTIDNFSNLKFKDNSSFSETKLKTFRRLDTLYLPINLDDKKEQFSGQVYLEAYKIQKEKKDLYLAEKNFQKCILIFPNSAVCYKKLEEIELLKENPDAANGYNKKYKDNDPFGLVN